MPNISKIFKDEIARVARKEMQQPLAAVRKSNATLKKTVTELKRTVALLHKELARGQRTASCRSAPEAAAAPADDLRVTAKQLKSLRSRLGISQRELMALIGASIQSVALWETKPGRIRIRKPHVRAALCELKGMKKAEVQERLQALLPDGAVRTRKPRTSGRARSGGAGGKKTLA
jgi:DNA-binding transcriptional regulator YiaG